MHQSIPTTALLALLPLLAQAQDNDPFYDNTPFPKPIRQAAFRVQSASLNPHEAICTPADYTLPRNYELIDPLGPGCTYSLYFSADFATSSDNNTGVAECAAHCGDDVFNRCKAFTWYLDTTTPEVGYCKTDLSFYDPTQVYCGPEEDTKSYTGVYNATGWSVLPDPVRNGGFESGCLDPWFFSDFTSDESMVPYIVDCAAAGDCAPGGGSSYFRVTGDGTKGSTRNHIDAYIGQQPALQDGAMYRLTANVRGPVGGEVRFTYPSHKSVKARLDALTGEWQAVDEVFEGAEIGTFLIQMDAPAEADFSIDNVKIQAI